MANIQFKKVVNSNKKKLQTLHNKFGKKTILKLEKDNKQYREVLKRQLFQQLINLTNFKKKFATYQIHLLEK